MIYLQIGVIISEINSRKYLSITIVLKSTRHVHELLPVSLLLPKHDRDFVVKDGIGNHLVRYLRIFQK